MASRTNRQVFAAGLAVLQIQRDGVNAGLRLRFCHHQPATGSATHFRDGVVFQQPHRFSKHRAAHPVTFQQRDFGPEDLPDPPAAGGDIVPDGSRQHLGELAVRRLAVGSAPLARAAGRLVVLQPRGHRLRVALAQCHGTCRVACGDRGDDASVFTVPPVDRVEGIARGVQSRVFGIPNGQSHQDVDKQLQHGIFGLLSQCCVKLVVRHRRIARAMLLGAQHRAQPVDARFIDPLRGKRCRQRLQQQPRIQQITDRGAQVLQVDDDGVSGRCGVGLADQQSAVRTTTHARDLVMLDESNGLPQHRSAHPVALLQRLLGTQRLPDRPAAPDDVGLDATCDL